MLDMNGEPVRHTGKDQGDLFVQLDRDGRFVYVSPSYCRTFGKTESELIGHVFPPLAPDESSRLSEEIRQGLLGPPYSWSIEQRVPVAAGWRRFAWSGASIPDEGGVVREIIFAGRDITDRGRTEQALFESEEKYRTLFEEAAEGIAVMSTDNETLAVNKSFARMHGYAGPEEMKHLRLEDLDTPETARLAPERLRQLLSGEPMNFEVEHYHRDGHTILLNVNCKVIQAEGKSYYMGLHQDITERRRTEEALRNLQKLDALGVMSGGIAHDFNNLLGGLFGFIELAGRSIQHDAAAREYIDSAMQCFSRAKELTQQLLTFARGGVPQKTIMALEPLVQESIRLALSGSSIRCEKKFQKGLRPIAADHGQINQVFNNILLNARQAMPGGGVITVSASNKILRDNEIADLRAGEYVQVAFEDQGHGIPRELLPKVFDPFFTTRSTGFGLGLTTSFSIIRKHGGHIVIESEPGHWTRVSLYLPAAHGFPAPETKKHESIPRGSGKILFMDDDSIIRSMASEMLKTAGYDVVCVGNGERAVEEYTAAMKQGGRFDAVILDLTVVDGMGGEKAARLLQDIDPDMRAIVSSGYSDSPVLADPQAYGFSARIAKPYQLDDFLKTLSELVGVGRNAPRR